MKIALVLAIIAVAANIVFIWYSKVRNKANTDQSSNPKNRFYALSQGYLNTPEVRRLRKSTAVELGLSIEELDRMLAKEIKQLAREQEWIN